MSQRTIKKLFVFESTSGSGTYQTLLYSDGTTSCDCRGWTFARGGIRSCKHTRSVEAGLGEREALRWVDYTSRTPPADLQPSVPATKPTRKGKGGNPAPAPRKFDFST